MKTKTKAVLALSLILPALLGAAYEIPRIFSSLFGGPCPTC